MIYPKKVALGLNRFYSGHFQNTPNIKTFFGYACVTMLYAVLIKCKYLCRIVLNVCTLHQFIFLQVHNPRDIYVITRHSVYQQDSNTATCQWLLQFWEGPGGTSYICIRGWGVGMEGKIQTQKHGFPENFAAKNIEILHMAFK